MPVPDDLRPIAQRINNQLGEIASFSRLRTRTHPYWYGRMLTELVLLAEGDEIVYVTGRLTDADAEVVVVTQGRLARSVVTGTTITDPTIVSTAWPLRRLTAVSASANEPVFGGEPFADWPGHLVVQLSIAEGPTISLPLERGDSGADEDHVLRSILQAALTTLGSTASP